MKKIVNTALLTAGLCLSRSLAAYAVTEAQVQSAGKEKAAGNLLIWFLCAIAFLKVSQKIDSFLSSLGIHVGHTGGSMMAELMVAARGLTTAGKSSGVTGFFNKSSSAGHGLRDSLLSGGLAGAVGRQFAQNAMNSATGQGGNPLGRQMFASSLQKGGGLASSVTSAVAQGSISHTDSMQGPQAAQALSLYMGHTGIPDAPSYSGVEIGGGRISGTETSAGHPDGTAFCMYHTDQYLAPSGSYETVTASDSTRWYRQYASNITEKTPYMTAQGDIAYRQHVVQKLPDMPKRKDRA